MVVRRYPGSPLPLTMVLAVVTSLRELGTEVVILVYVKCPVEYISRYKRGRKGNADLFPSSHRRDHTRMVLFVL